VKREKSIRQHSKQADEVDQNAHGSLRVGGDLGRGSRDFCDLRHLPTRPVAHVHVRQIDPQLYRPSAQAAVRGWHLPRDRSSELQRLIAAFWASGQV